MVDEIIEVYIKEEEIKPLSDKLKSFSFDDLVKTDHFYYSIDEKNTDLPFIKSKFKEFEKIRLVQKRKHRNNNVSYDFYYEMEDGTYVLYAIMLEQKPILLNAFHVNRNFKQLRKRLLKAYKGRIMN